MSKKLDDIEGLYTEDNYGNKVMYAEFVDELLAHARALEEMLRRHEWDTRMCLECGEYLDNGHSPDCALAKLLE